MRPLITVLVRVFWGAAACGAEEPRSLAQQVGVKPLHQVGPCVGVWACEGGNLARFGPTTRMALA